MNLHQPPKSLCLDVKQNSLFSIWVFFTNIHDSGEEGGYVFMTYFICLLSVMMFLWRFRLDFIMFYKISCTVESLFASIPVIETINYFLYRICVCEETKPFFKK